MSITLINRLVGNVEKRQYHSNIDNYLTIGNITFLLIVSTVISSFTTTFKGVYCNTPIEISNAGWSSYTDAQCYINGIFGDPVNKKQFSLYYYVWTSYITFIPILFFTLPRFYWSYYSKDYESGIKRLITMSRNSSSDFQKAVEEYFTKKDEFKGRKKFIKLSEIESDEDKYLAFSDFRKRINKNDVARKYLYYKFLLLLASIAFFQYTKYVFHVQSNSEGVDFIIKKLNDTSYRHPNLFPTNVWCETTVNDIKRTRKQYIRYNCTMPYNYIYQVIFGVLFIYAPITIIISGISFILWFYALLYKPHRTEYFKNILRMANNQHVLDKDFYIFVSHFSKTDYVFFQLVSEKISCDETGKAIENVFKAFKKQGSNNHYNYANKLQYQTLL